MAFAPDGATLYTAALDGRVVLWDTRTARPRASFAPHTGGVHAIAVHPDGTRFATGGRDRAIRVWRTADRRLLRQTIAHEGSVDALAYHPRGHWLASGGLRTVRLWDRAGRVQATLTGHRSRIFGLAFHPDGTRLASASKDHTIRLWRLPAAP